MDKKNLDHFKEILEKEKEELEEQLRSFAKKDGKVKGEWDTKFPKMDAASSGSESMEAAADEVEEYSELLPVEHSLELQLQSINEALKKIKNGTYGKCSNCDKEIPLDRLEASPESSVCLDCESQK